MSDIDAEDAAYFRAVMRDTRTEPQAAQVSADTDDIDWDKRAEERLGQRPVEDEPTPAVKRAMAHFWKKATQYDHEKLQAIYNDMHELQDRVETIPLSQALDAMDLALQIIDRLLDEPQAPSMRAALEDISNWLEGCLTCKTWSWDGLQRDAAEKALEDARAALALLRPQSHTGES
jgi:hemerythrin superfamily protein